MRLFEVSSDAAIGGKVCVLLRWIKGIRISVMYSTYIPLTANPTSGQSPNGENGQEKL